MAATHDLVVSLSQGDLGWHFRHCGEPNHVQETERGLRELGLEELAELFCEAYEIVLPHMQEIRVSDDYVECLRREGRLNRITELTREVAKLDEVSGERVSGSAIYAAWIRYTREHVTCVFPV